jgi:hypothetical protein
MAQRKLIFSAKWLKIKKNIQKKLRFACPTSAYEKLTKPHQGSQPNLFCPDRAILGHILKFKDIFRTSFHRNQENF